MLKCMVEDEKLVHGVSGFTQCISGFALVTKQRLNALLQMVAKAQGPG